MVGFWQEHKADNAIELLKERLAPTARVDPHIHELESRTGVGLGDVVLAHEFKAPSRAIYLHDRSFQ